MLQILCGLPHLTLQCIGSWQTSVLYGCQEKIIQFINCLPLNSPQMALIVEWHILVLDSFIILNFIVACITITQRQCCSNSSSSMAEDWKFNQNIYYPYKVAYSKLASSFSVAILVMTFILHILHLHLEQQLLPLCQAVACAWSVWCTSREKGGQ